MSKDYYKILGIEKNASKEEIKKAFRKAAQKYHPDKPNGDEAKFKEINEAYGVLSDDKKKTQYDQFGSAFSGGGAGTGGFSGFDGFDFSGFQTAQGTHVEFDLNDILNSIFKGGGFDGMRMRRGRDISVDLTIEFKESILGAQKTISITKNNGSKKDIKFTIPPGIDNGEMLRIREEGESIEGGRSGDLYVRMHVKKHDYLKKEGVNLVMNMPIKLSEAVFGAKYEFDTLEEKVTLKIPKGITHGEILRIKGKGVPIQGRTNGDLLVRIQIQIPQNLSKKAKKAFEDLKEEGL
jgi:DnaJ-class molecular chaperone